MTRPLEDIRIIAVEQYGAGPFATQYLADLGAEVIKIENPATGGDVGRHVGPYFFGENDSQFFQSFNRNKKSVTLNLKDDEGQEIFREMVKGADAVFDNLRGDIPEKLGLTYDDLKALNPAIVCGHLSAYGRTGSRKAWPGYDYLMQAEAGYLSLTGEPGQPPARFGLSIVDMMTGTTAALGLMAGISRARATGIGGDIDVSLFDVAINNLNYLGTWYLHENVVTGRDPRSAHPSLTPSQLYKTRDGWILIMCNKEKFWKVLAARIGKPEWADDERFCNFTQRLANRALLTELLDEVLLEHDTAYWLEQFGGQVPAAPVNDVGEALDSPFATERGTAVETEHAGRGSIKTLASPIRYNGAPPPLKAASGLGEDTEAELRKIRDDTGWIQSLRDKQVI
ncbi:CaiB/BaiF CoA transferase family protein [Salinisphaera aquimarina]|uniref:CaiB/BaiF CoA transferase family protein n=1 Tax=Salinisphaera aquimarina TaxID=2094031 RepID=A0ABV7ETP6_9GAMM